MKTDGETLRPPEAGDAWFIDGVVNAVKKNSISLLLQHIRFNRVLTSTGCHALEAKDPIELFDIRQKELGQNKLGKRLIRHGATAIVMSRQGGPLWLLLRQPNGPPIFVFRDSVGLALEQLRGGP